jgi:putative CocE/NonD family hydrolase
MTKRGKLYFGIAAAVGLALPFIASRPSVTDRLAERFFLPTNVRQAEYAVRTSRDAAFQTSDGITLAADIHTPVGLEKSPTILVRIPFNNSYWNRMRSDSIARFWAKRGYTVVIQGTRGRYRSGGTFYPAVNERQDGIETLDWLKAQPWFDGRLAMWGGSAFGHTQWAISDLGEDGPGVFSLQISSSSYYGTFHRGGAFALESALYWALVSPPEKDRETSGDEIQRGADGWPVVEADDRALKDVAFFNDWTTHRMKDKYWQTIDGEDRAKKVSAPILLLGGWYDPFLPTMLEDFKTLKQDNPHAAAQASRIIIGPYVHAGDIEWPGAELEEPYRQASVEPVIDWFDYWLGVRDTPQNNSPVRIYVMGDNVWRDEDEWPLARTEYTPFYFAASGSLSQTPPASADSQLQYTFDPQSPVPTRGGAMLGPRAGIMLQDAPGTRDDVLSFATLPLEADMEVTGPITATLHVSTDAVSTDFTVKILDVHEDGRAYNVADGILRRDYEPGQAQKIEIALDPTSFVFKTGHQIRVDVSSSNFPRFDRNTNTGGDPAFGTKTAIARQALQISRDLPSLIVLPVIPR